MPYFNPLAEQADSDLEDLDLVARVQAGNRKAVETLLQRHQPWIYKILVRMLSSRPRPRIDIDAASLDTAASPDNSRMST